MDLQQIMSTYGNTHLQMAYFYTEDWHVAEEVLQKVFLAASKSNVKSTEFETMLLKDTMNFSKQYVQKKKKTVPFKQSTKLKDVIILAEYAHLHSQEISKFLTYSEPKVDKMLAKAYETLNKDLFERSHEDHFDEAMQARITAHIKNVPLQKRPKDLMYPLIMAGIGIALILLFMTTMNTDYIFSTSTVPMDESIQKVYTSIVIDDKDAFDTTTSFFDSDTTVMKNEKKIKLLEQYVKNAKETTLPKNTEPAADLIIRYANDETFAFRVYTEDGNYWLSNRATNKVYGGKFSGDDWFFYELTESKNTWIFFLFIVFTSFILPMIIQLSRNRSKFIPRSYYYVSEQHRLLHIIAIVAAIAFTFFGFLHDSRFLILYIICFSFIPFIVDFYYEYRYDRLFKKYIDTVITYSYLVLIIIIYTFLTTYF